MARRSNHSHANEGLGTESFLSSIMDSSLCLTKALNRLEDSFIRNPVHPDILMCHKIGHGGFGRVFIATVAGSEAKVAVKEMDDVFAFCPWEPDWQVRLREEVPLAEASIQGILVHTNIVRTLWVEANFTDAATEEDLGEDATTMLRGAMLQAQSTADLPSQRLAPCYEIRAKNPLAYSPRSDSSSFDPSSPAESSSGEDPSFRTTSSRGFLPDCISLNIRIVMEFCEFGSLDNYLRAARRTPTPLSTWIGRSIKHELCAMLTARDIARALKLIHRYAIIHGDIKPGNILLSADPQDPRGWVAKVGDFGLSRRLRRGFTEIGGVMQGSVAYICPSVLASTTASQKSDIRSLGLIIWELWHNRYWGALFFEEMKRRKCSAAEMRDFRPICSSSCPEILTKIIYDCLNGVPAQRPRSAQVLQRLEIAIDKYIMGPNRPGV